MTTKAWLDFTKENVSSQTEVNSSLAMISRHSGWEAPTETSLSLINGGVSSAKMERGGSVQASLQFILFPPSVLWFEHRCVMVLIRKTASKWTLLVPQLKSEYLDRRQPQRGWDPYCCICPICPHELIYLHQGGVSALESKKSYFSKMLSSNYTQRMGCLICGVIK